MTGDEERAEYDSVAENLLSTCRHWAQSKYCGGGVYQNGKLKYHLRQHERILELKKGSERQTLEELGRNPFNLIWDESERFKNRCEGTVNEYMYILRMGETENQCTLAVRRVPIKKRERTGNAYRDT